MPSSSTREAPCHRNSTTPTHSTPSTAWPTARRSPTRRSWSPTASAPSAPCARPTVPCCLIHDTTELDYTSLTSLTGLGQIGNGNGRGYECHNTLAVHAPTRTVLGLANQILARRDTVGKGESRQARRERETRESRLWKRGSEAVGPAPEGALWVDVCDRGADVFEYIAYKHKSSGHYIVRSKHDRLCTVLIDGVPCRRKLHAHARALEPLGGRYVSVAARDGHPARRAKVLIAAGKVELVAPKQPRGDHGPEPLPLHVVVLREVEAPEGVDPLEWILLSELPAGDLAEAGGIADWYGYRPIVEEFHKGMKTGCGVETLQFTTEAAIQPVIALLSVVAVFLLGLRDAARDPATADEAGDAIRAGDLLGGALLAGGTARCARSGRSGSSIGRWVAWADIRTARTARPRAGWC